MVEDTRASVNDDLDDDAVDLSGDPPTPEEEAAAAEAAEAAAKEAQAKVEERERVLTELGDYFLVMIPKGVPGIGFYMTRVSIDQNGVPTVDRATIIAILQKITRDLITLEEIDFQKQVTAQMVAQEQQRVDDAKRQQATARILVPKVR